MLWQRIALLSLMVLSRCSSEMIDAPTAGLPEVFLMMPEVFLKICHVLWQIQEWSSGHTFCGMWQTPQPSASTSLRTGTKPISQVCLTACPFVGSVCLALQASWAASQFDLCFYGL